MTIVEDTLLIHCFILFNTGQHGRVLVLKKEFIEQVIAERLRRREQLLLCKDVNFVHPG